MANFNLALFLAFLLLIHPGSTNSRIRICDCAIINSAGTPIALRAEIADTDELRLNGLMHRRVLGLNAGMLFVFENEQMLRFWMKNTYIPLSIAYIGDDGIIRDILDMRPLDTSVTYPSSKPARYAIEVNRGWFSKNNIRVGARLVLDGCIGK